MPKPTPLLDAMRGDSSRRAPTCTMALILEELGPDERAEVELALAEKSITHAAIARVLSKDPRFDIRGMTVGRHRHGECACPKQEA